MFSTPQLLEPLFSGKRLVKEFSVIFCITRFFFLQQRPLSLCLLIQLLTGCFHSSFQIKKTTIVTRLSFAGEKKEISWERRNKKREIKKRRRSWWKPRHCVSLLFCGDTESTVASVHQNYGSPYRAARHPSPRGPLARWWPNPIAARKYFRPFFSLFPSSGRDANRCDGRFLMSSRSAVWNKSQ